MKKMGQTKYSAWMILLLLLAVAAAMALIQPAQAAGEEKASRFTDVKSNATNAIFIDYLAQRGIFSGFPDGAFRPDQGITRAQAACVLVKTAGLKV
ncbi:MAG: S-layer homology domain-containing protein, partial [Syntrophomonas sp.]